MPEPSAETPKRAVYDGSISGAQDRPYIPHLRSDPPSFHPLPRSLAEFRNQEGREYRKARLERARQMRKMYERELMGRCKSSGHIEWKEFKMYADDKEAG